MWQFIALAIALSPQQKSNIDLILEFSQFKNIEPYNLLAIAHTESRFKENAISSTGDIGLLQINCKTWYKYFGISSIKECFSLLSEPSINISLAFIILEKYKSSPRCRGNYIFNCYNGGPNWRRSKNREAIERYGRIVGKRSRIFKSKYKDRLNHLSYTKRVCEKNVDLIAWQGYHSSYAISNY